MTAKHKPATALPWIEKRSVFGVSAIVSKPEQDSADAEANLWTGRIFRMAKSENRRQDALYAMHAANAYPKLVAAIKGQYAGTFEQLLRDIGEAE